MGQKEACERRTFFSGSLGRVLTVRWGLSVFAKSVYVWYLVGLCDGDMRHTSIVDIIIRQLDELRNSKLISKALKFGSVFKCLVEGMSCRFRDLVVVKNVRNKEWWNDAANVLALLGYSSHCRKIKGMCTRSG
jgi:hypothetical protein